MSDDSSRPPAGDRAWPLLLATLALGSCLRVLGLTHQSLSHDEVADLRNATRGLTEILRTADGFPPLYNLLLHGWLDLFGDGLAARWLSLLLGILSILVGWLLGRRLGGDAVGHWTALLLAVSPLHIWYSQEARAYPLYILLATITLWILLRALENDSLVDWSVYATTAVAGMYTHYFFVAILIIGGVAVLARRRGRHELAKPIVAHAAIAALCLPLLWLMLPDFGFQAGYEGQKSFGVAALLYTYVSIVTGYTLGPSLRELHTMKMADAFTAFLPWLALLASALAILGYHGWRVLGRPAFDRLILLVVAPVAMIGVLSLLAGVGYNVRYVVWVAVPGVVLLAAGATRWRRWEVASALTILLGLFGVALANRHLSDRYRNEDVRAASAYLMSRPESEIPIFVLSSYMVTPTRYYLGQERAIHALLSAPHDSLRVSRALERIRSRTPAGKPYWLVYTRPFHGDPHGAVREALEHRDKLRAVTRFAGVVLYRGVTPEKDSRESIEDPVRPQRSAS